VPGNESQPPEANEHDSHLLRSRLGLINSTKYDGSNQNHATVGSSGHATGVPKVVTKGSKIVRECVATLLGLTTK
jgi:hypothetical protein